MIIANLKQLYLYRLGAVWQNALQWLEQQDPAQSGDGFGVHISEYMTKSHELGMYETHTRYVDIQLLLSGTENIYCAPRAGLRPLGDYDTEKDVRFYENDRAAVCVTLVPQLFAVFFPDDGHMPNIMVEKPELVKKIVLKIPMTSIENQDNVL